MGRTEEKLSWSSPMKTQPFEVSSSERQLRTIKMMLVDEDLDVGTGLSNEMNQFSMRMATDGIRNPFIHL